MINRLHIALFAGLVATATPAVEVPSPPYDGSAGKSTEPAVLCDKPCVRVPGTVAQGDTIAVRFSGFHRNTLVKFTLQGKWIFKRHYQSGPVDAFDYMVPQGLPDGDYDIVGESGEGADKLSAKGTIRVAGKRKPPTLEAVPVPLPGNKYGWYRLGVNRIHVRGQHWTVRAPFSADLVGVTAGLDVDRDRIYSLSPPYLDGCPASGCNLSLGEISQFWQMDATVPPGRYVLRMGDGFSEAITKAFDVLPTEDGEAAPKPAPPPVAKPPVETPTPPAPPVTRRGQTICNPELPRLWQPDCVPADRGGGSPPSVQRTPPDPVSAPPASKPLPPQAAPGTRYCNPNVPHYAQAGCVELTASPPAPAPACNPNVPRYAQPGCRE